MLADLLIGRAEVDAPGALGGDREAGGGDVGTAGRDFGQQVGEAVGLDELEFYAQVVGEAAGQFVVRAFGAGRTHEVGDRAVAGDDPQLAEGPDFLQQ